MRLRNMGADFITATRGGQLTYHGPGQIVGYPLIDLSRWKPTIAAKDYVCRLQKLLKNHLNEAHNITTSPSEHTGVFLDPTTKIASIGVQVRHRLTSHGFAINITNEPLHWFNQIVACGLDDVHAGSIESKLGRPIDVQEQMRELTTQFGKMFERDMATMDIQKEGEIGAAILALEKEAELAGTYASEPQVR